MADDKRWCARCEEWVPRMGVHPCVKKTKDDLGEKPKGKTWADKAEAIETQIAKTPNDVGLQVQALSTKRMAARKKAKAKPVDKIEEGLKDALAIAKAAVKAVDEPMT